MKNNKNTYVVSCPPCGENVALATKRGAYKAISLMSPSIGPADHFLRKGGRLGFTLIELLVVVLIIGILAAVAVPQYQVAVTKSRYMQMMVLARTLYKAEEVYALNNGAWTTDLDKLDVMLPIYDTNTKHAYTSNKRNIECYKGSNQEIYCGMSDGLRLWWLRKGINLETTTTKGIAQCFFDTTVAKADLFEKVCKNVCGGVAPVAWFGTLKKCQIKM